MIVWGGVAPGDVVLDSGGRYDPATDSWSPTSNIDAPEPRVYDTAVWTGEEMIVWGGAASAQAETGYFDSGARYDPATDTWTHTSNLDAPSGREFHTAVWTGTRMIVWSGTTETGDANSGGRYDPVRDSWAPTSTIGAPVARYGHTAVWTGAEMIGWGGNAGGVPPNSEGRYDPIADAWSPTTESNAPPGREGHTAVWTGAQMIVWGGFWHTSPPFDSGGQYTPGPPRDEDGDGLQNSSDNCPFITNLDQADIDSDLVGDACDLDDGQILIGPGRDSRVEWQQEAGFEAFNLYRGNLAVLKASGIYTQDPDTVPLAGRECGSVVAYADDDSAPAPGEGVFFLVTGVHLGVEGSLGLDSAGVERPNSHPCP
jgi:hypothetical protein